MQHMPCRAPFRRFLSRRGRPTPPSRHLVMTWLLSLGVATFCVLVNALTPAGLPRVGATSSTPRDQRPTSATATAPPSAASIGSAQDPPQDSFNKTSRIHAPGKISPHHAGIRVNVIGTPDRSGEGPDAAIEIPGISALCCHFGVHPSECG